MSYALPIFILMFVFVVFVFRGGTLLLQSAPFSPTIVRELVLCRRGNYF